MSHKNALAQYESGLCPANYGMSLRGLSARQLLRHSKGNQNLKGGLSEEPLKRLPALQEKLHITRWVTNIVKQCISSNST